jgi:hypothetical protein
LSQWYWIHEHYRDVVSDFSVLHRVDDPEALHPYRFVDLAMRLMAYQGAVRFGVQEEANTDDASAPAALDQDRTVDSEYAAADPILGQFVEVTRVEVVD